MTPPFGKCVWCERTDFTEEHIIGRQFAKAVGIELPIPSYFGQFEMPEREGIVLKDRVCDTCNKNWMRKLDNKAMKCLRPALETDARIELNTRNQEVVAAWATKVALLLALRQIDVIATYPDLAENDKAFVPDDSFKAIARHQRKPPGDTRVWLGQLSPAQGRAPYVEHVWLVRATEDR